MLPRLLELLVCPICKLEFTLENYLSEGENIIRGLLICSCGKRYPIINSVPRILSDTFNMSSATSRVLLDQKQFQTKKSFGYQWRIFKKMSDGFEDNFLNYIYPIKKSFFKGKLGLDAGCGFGRHIFYAAQFGAEMVGIDFSESIDSAYQNTKHLSNVHLVQCDIYSLPFKEEIFDFIYCIGVLHHLPDPEVGFKSLFRFLKKKAPLLIWVYSRRRKFTNFCIEAIRKMTRILPLKVILVISFIMAYFDWVFFVLPYKFMLKLKLPKKIIDRITFPRIRLYAQYPFEVSCADWFDRLSPPIRFYYDADEVRQWFVNMKMNNIKVSETGLYGWRGYGERQG